MTKERDALTGNDKHRTLPLVLKNNRSIQFPRWLISSLIFVLYVFTDSITWHQGPHAVQLDHPVIDYTSITIYWVKKMLEAKK